MSAPKMLLFPSSPETPPVAEQRLVRQLQALGLIGERCPLQGGVFYPAGEQFLQLVTFLGCSPAIELEPPHDPQRLEQASAEGRFCHVFVSSGDRLRFRHDSRTRPPYCPGCRSPEADWEALLQAPPQNLDPLPWRCRACGYCGRLSDLVFRKTAGFGRTFLEIRGIYPAEAVPGQALLDCLAAITGGPWTTIYLRE